MAESLTAEVIWAIFYLGTVILTGLIGYWYGRIKTQLEYERKAMDAMWMAQRKEMWKHAKSDPESSHCE